jgi:hypothetical protein
LIGNACAAGPLERAASISRSSGIFAKASQRSAAKQVGGGRGGSEICCYSFGNIHIETIIYFAATSATHMAGKIDATIS